MESGEVKNRKIWNLIPIVFLFVLSGCLHNDTPIADAGKSITVTVGSNVDLDGSKSYDPDGEIVEFKWQLIAIPNGSNAFIQADAVYPSFTADLAGAYVIGLVVFDGELYSDEDIVVVTATTDNADSNDSPDPTLQPDSKERYITMIDNPIIINKPFDIEDSGVVQNTPTTGVNNNEVNLSSRSIDLENSWIIMSQPQNSIASIEKNEDMEFVFIADTIGDYELAAIISVNTAEEQIVKTIVTVQESEVFAGDDNDIVIGVPIQPIVSFIDEVDQLNAITQWRILTKPDDSNAKINMALQKPVLIADVVGQYELQVTVTTVEGDYVDTVLLDATDGDDATSDHSNLTTPCTECHVSPDLPPRPIPEPLFPEGLEMTISGIGATYQTGELIKLTATLANNSDVDIEYYKMSSSSVGVVVEIETAAGTRFNLRNPKDPDFDLQVVSKAILMPGESIVRAVEWDQTIPGAKVAIPGDYQVNAFAFITNLDSTKQSEFATSGIIKIESAPNFISEIDALLIGLKDVNVNNWYMKSEKSILCATQSRGTVLINDFIVTPIQTLVAVPESEINCRGKLLSKAKQWQVIYKSSNKVDNTRFEIYIDAITGEILIPE